MQDNPTDPDATLAKTLGLNRLAPQGRPIKPWLVWLALAGVLAVIAIIWGTRDNAATVQYQTQAVKRGALTVAVTATGALQPINQVDVGSELSGIIKSVAVDFNQRVTAGQILATLDTTRLEAQVAQSRAALAAAQAKVVQTQATVKQTANDLARLRRMRTLSHNQLPSLQELDAAEATLTRARADATSAEATVAQAQATLKTNTTDLSKAEIRSPINGMVLTRAAEPGQTVAASLQAPVLFTLAEDLASMELHVDVDEADVGRVRAGQTASFTVDAYPERAFPAHITEVRYGARTVSGVVTYETVLNVDNSDLSLRPGMTATATVIIQQVDNALLAPNAALRFTPHTAQAVTDTRSGITSLLLPRRPSSLQKPRKKSEPGAALGKQQVWVLRDDLPVAIPVTVGVTDGVHTEIRSGDVQEGMALLVDTVSNAQ